MNKLYCLVIEDEPLAAEGLEEFIRQVPTLEWAGSCTDALTALEVLRKQRVDVLFLDIHLPKLKGLDFLKTLQNPPQVILTTAYHQYALESYELNVVDYLLKPFGFPRFLAAVNKLSIGDKLDTSGGKDASAFVLPGAHRPFHFFNENKRQVKVFHDEILYVESLKEYVKLFLTNRRTVVTRIQLGELETLLHDANLLRIHRSYLVSKDKVTAFSSTEVEINGYCLPIGRSYQKDIAVQLSTRP